MSPAGEVRGREAGQLLMADDSGTSRRSAIRRDRRRIPSRGPEIMIPTRREPSPVRQALSLLVMVAVLAAPAAAPYLDAAEPHHGDRVQSPASNGPHHVHHDHELCLQLRDAPADAGAPVPALPGSDRIQVDAEPGPERPHLSHPQRRLSPARAPPLS